MLSCLQAGLFRGEEIEALGLEVEMRFFLSQAQREVERGNLPHLLPRAFGARRNRKVSGKLQVCFSLCVCGAGD